MNKALYPKNWKEIAMDVKNRADWKCENCGKQCRRPGEHFDTHKRTLTVSHKNHIPQDVRPCNLQALCAPCHLRYDARHHAETRSNKKGNERMTLSQLTNKLQDLCHNGHSLSKVIVRDGDKEKTIERIELAGESQTVSLVLNDTSDKFVDIVKKIETLDKTKLYIVTIGNADFQTATDLCDCLKDNGIKAVFLQEDIKMIPAKEAREVIEYVEKEFGIKDGDLK